MLDSAFARLVAAAESYFLGEKIQATVFVCVGCAGLLAGVWLRRKPSAFLRGVAVPFGVVGAGQIIAGATVWIRSTSQLGRVTSLAVPAAEELSRMREVLGAFDLYAGAKLLLLFAGFLLTLFARRKPSLRGAGFGLLLQSAILLPLDVIAAKRAVRYVDVLGDFVAGAPPP